MIDDNFDALLDMAVREDIGEPGDVTTLAIFGEETGRARLISKGSGILAGSGFFTRVFERFDPWARVSFMTGEGGSLAPGDEVAEVRASVRAILGAERISINFLSFLSGIASLTRTYVDAARSAGRTVILDTRKTLPGYRGLSKYAVRVGGGRNHRLGLYDMVLIKDNHIDAAGSIKRAVALVRERWADRFRVEVECRTAEEVSEALESGVDIIMLDNMDGAEVAQVVRAAAGRVQFESSGDMTVEKVIEHAATGVDYISVGRLTHSVSAFNFSLQMDRRDE